MDKKSLSHTAWKCQYHIVFIPKYRKKALFGSVRADIRDIIKTLCGYKGVEIIEGAVCIDHVHLCVCIPPKLSVSNFMGYLKGKSALTLWDRVLVRIIQEHCPYISGTLSASYRNVVPDWQELLPDTSTFL